MSKIYTKVPDEQRKRWANNDALDALFKKRKPPVSITSICEAVTLNRQAVSQVLSGVRPGSVTWKKLGKVMTAEEWACARDFANKARARKDLPALKHIDFVEQPGAHDVAV